MKTISFYTLIFGLLFSTATFSQINENVQKETTVKKVTIKDTNVQTIVEEEVDESVEVVEVEGTSETNQKSDEKTVKNQKVKVVDVIDEGENEENQKNLEKVKKDDAKRMEAQQQEVPSKPIPTATNKKKKGDD